MVVGVYIQLPDGCKQYPHFFTTQVGIRTFTIKNAQFGSMQCCSYWRYNLICLDSTRHPRLSDLLVDLCQPHVHDENASPSS